MMEVKLIAVTQPVGDDALGTAEELLAYCARVSNPANQRNTDTTGKLLRYCMVHEHWSVFEMASMVVEITTTRDIARQILRHRSFHFQEHSQRYASAAAIVAEVRDARSQDTANRQNSLPVSNGDLSEWWQTAQETLLSAAQLVYQKALLHGIAREVARAVLPEGLTTSRMYMHGTVRDFYHYCRVRCGPETQKEHREVAKAVRNILLTQFPALKESTQ